MRLVALVFALLFVCLAAGYYLFLRPGYAEAFGGLRPADAAAIVTQLEAKGIPYRLADGGTTVLVPEDRVDPARVAVAGSDVPMKGAVGFELFNKSDMGLTEFAQKINYQRALQGELERTILTMSGIESARVHLALPERSLFRAERSTPKAAVELVTKPGQSLDQSRVAGIQRLVANAVPDLAPGDVAVLDGDGRSFAAASGDVAPVLDPAAEEQQGLEHYYRARVRSAVAQALPGLSFEVAVATRRRDASAVSGSDKPSRDFALAITLATTAPLDAEQEQLARAAAAHAAALDEAHGDQLGFAVGTLSPAAVVPVARLQVPSAAPTLPPVGTAAGSAEGWLPIALGMVLVALLGAILLRRQGRTDADLVLRLKQALAPEGA